MKVPDEIRSSWPKRRGCPPSTRCSGPTVPLYDSAIVSVPGAKTQDMHCDNGHLFLSFYTYRVAALCYGHLSLGRR